jgi:Xaa-Pro aminopeptidase
MPIITLPEVSTLFFDEPGIFLAGNLGVRIEHSAEVTETGGKRLDEDSRELTVMD